MYVCIVFLMDTPLKLLCFCNRLISSNVMEVVDCNNHVKSAIEFFGESCAVDSLRDRYNPLGDNPHKFCELCGSATPGIRCTNRDPYAEYAGALRYGQCRQ